MSMVSAEQYRIEQVQILNWGGYAGLQVMRAGRASTAILGPSGRGKSTLLDAMASVIMPNPQEFNQAARDDKGRKRERTVYTYARGLTVSHQDDNGRSATPSYLRPPGGAGFISGAAITWSTGMGKRVTAFRLACTSTVQRALRRRGLLLPTGFRADRRSWARLRKRVFRDPPRQRNRVWQMDFSEFETARGGIWRICAVIDYATKYCLAATVTPTSRGQDALGCLRRAVAEAERVPGLDDRATIGDGNALAVEVNLSRHTYNTLRPHQALDERTPRAAYLAVEHCD